MAAKSEARPLFGSFRLFYLKMPGRPNSIDLEVPGGDKSKEKNTLMWLQVAKLMLVMYQCQREAGEQLKPKEKQIEDVTGKFRYHSFGYPCMVTVSK